MLTINQSAIGIKRNPLVRDLPLIVANDLRKSSNVILAQFTILRVGLKVLSGTLGRNQFQCKRRLRSHLSLLPCCVLRVACVFGIRGQRGGVLGRNALHNFIECVANSHVLDVVVRKVLPLIGSLIAGNR